MIFFLQISILDTYFCSTNIQLSELSLEITAHLQLKKSLEIKEIKNENFENYTHKKSAKLLTHVKNFFLL